MYSSKEKIGKCIFGVAAAVSIVSVVSIFAFLMVKSVPAILKIGISDLLIDSRWSPDRLDTYADRLSGRYGIFTMIVGTLVSTAGAMLIGGTLGYFTAVFLSYYCPEKLRSPLTSVIRLLAGIPSVVYGFFGVSFLLPLLSHFAPNNGSGLLATSLILGIMILPTVVSLSRTALDAVPKAYYEGAVALGSTHTHAVFNVIVPAARSGITSALVLGIGRALGETMAVVMVAGNAPTLPDGLFQSFRVLTANIVMEMGYAGQVQEGALVATGVVLLIFVFFINLLFMVISEKSVKRSVDRNNRVRIPLIDLSGVGKICAYASGIVCVAVLVLVIGFIMYKGLPELISDPSLVLGKYEFGSEDITVLPAIVTTLMAVALSITTAMPIGIMTAVYLSEYARADSLFVKIVRGALNVLSGVPSVIYGLFGMITFVKMFGGSSSILAGSLTVSIMLLPIVVGSTEESLKTVPGGLREGSLALGSGKLRTVLNIVLPSAMPGIVAAFILSVGRVISESAPFLYTMGSIISAVPTGYGDSGATLAVALYQLSGEGWYMDEAYATAVILVLMVLILNFISEVFSSKLTRKLIGGNDARIEKRKKAVVQ